MLTLGCDPGYSGGVVVINSKSGKYEAGHRLKSLKTNPERLNALLLELSENVDLCLIEKVHAFSGQGVKSVFTFGKAFGQLIQAAHLTVGKVEYVTPQKWQKHFNLIVPKTSNITKTQKKNLHKALACKLAGCALPHALADAYLIARYAYETIQH